ncbi:NADH dehydrogenase, FAD-containing subunit [Actinobacteria bacterium IMCC26207]|nr:NADH dehydrogenase, FAD-containing subunit [Actinobacteria bacterium IMCC26207]
MSDRPVVLVLGAGFGGIGVISKLKKAPVDIVLIDQHDYHTFRPLLYQVATDVLEPTTVGYPIRSFVDRQKNLSFTKATVTGVDLENRVVSFSDWEPQHYDYLVVALGGKANFLNISGAEEHSFPLYTLNDAVKLRQHVLTKFEAANKSHELVEAGALNVVIVGGGPTGVETAGAMAELYYSSLARDFPGIPVADASITLVEYGDRLLTMFDQGLSDYTKEALEERGVTVRLGESVTEIKADSVTLNSGETLEAHTTVWGAGLSAVPLASTLSDDIQHGRVPTEPMLHLAGRPEVFVIGDLAWTTDTKTEKVLPQLGSVALQAGEHVGKTIDRMTRKHKEPEPFSYFDKGSMATIGRKAAVAALPPDIHLTGMPAALVWGSVHLALLSGAENRAVAMTNWSFAYMHHDRPSRIIIDLEDED